MQHVALNAVCCTEYDYAECCIVCVRLTRLTLLWYFLVSSPFVRIYTLHHQLYNHWVNSAASFFWLFW